MKNITKSKFYMEKRIQNDVIRLFVGILFLFTIFTPQWVLAQKTAALDTIINCNEVTYGKKFYAICQTMLIELAGSKPGYMNLV